jgi:hypothetical protein
LDVEDVTVDSIPWKDLNLDDGSEIFIDDIPPSCGY